MQHTIFSFPWVAVKRQKNRQKHIIRVPRVKGFRQDDGGGGDVLGRGEVFKEME